MFEIIKKESLAPNVELLRVAAPLIADKAQPGHFVVVRNNQQGERIPLTIADYDRAAGTIDLVIQAIGYSTKELCKLEVGDEILDILGPLGEPIEIEELGTVLCVAGGIGVAPIYPKAKELKAAGNQIITLVGAQSEEMIIMKDRLEAVSDEIYFSTDDGSLGHEGFVTDLLERELASEREIDEVIAIGPVVMMEAACQVTAKYDVDTMVSLNPIMIDGTGMCGGCRVTVGDKKQFACIDGPAFDGHAVDFAELSRRQDHYEMKEKQAEHQCRLDQEVAADE